MERPRDSRGLGPPLAFGTPVGYGDCSGESLEGGTLSRTCRQGVESKDALSLPQPGRAAEPWCLVGPPASWPPHLQSGLPARPLRITESETPVHSQPKRWVRCFQFTACPGRVSRLSGSGIWWVRVNCEKAGAPRSLSDPQKTGRNGRLGCLG